MRHRLIRRRIEMPRLFSVRKNVSFQYLMHYGQYRVSRMLSRTEHCGPARAADRVLIKSLAAVYPTILGYNSWRGNRAPHLE